jgi:hypothetical protein
MDGSDQPETPTQTTRRWPSFSLLTLLLLTAIAALAITVTLLWREIGPLRADNKRLHEERGTLMVEDRSRLHAIKIPDRFAGEGRESYRIFVPENSRYWAFVVVNNIPKEGYPQLKRYPDKHGILGSGTNLPLFGRLEPGEHVLTLRTMRYSATKADVKLIIDGLDASANTPTDRWPTVVPETYSVFGDGVKGETTRADDSGRLVLKRHRIQAVSSEGLHASFSRRHEPDYNLDGVMVWIEPAPDKVN